MTIRCVKAVYEPPSSGRAVVHFTEGPTMLRARLAAAIKLRRPVAANEVVHHINGDSLDDRLENLAVFANQAAHARHHISLKTRATTNYYKFLLRLPVPVAAQLKEAADANHRSLNSEILWRLQQSLSGYRR